jgi:hypothetical protein
MSYVSREREAMISRQKWAAIIALLLMVPVILDVIGVIHLGSWRLAPFMILLTVAPAMAARPKDERERR